MNFGDMKTQFTNLLNRRDLTTSLTSSFFTLSIARIQRDLRAPPMEKTVSVVIATGSTYAVGTGVGLAIPSDLLQLIKLQVFDATSFRGDLSGRDLAIVKNAALVTDIPIMYCREGSEWVFGPKPLDGLTIRANYYAELSALAADADSNTLTTVAPDLFIYGALSYAGDYYSDSRAPAWEARYQNIFTSVQGQADRDELTAQKVVSPAYDFQDEPL